MISVCARGTSAAAKFQSYAHREVGPQGPGVTIAENACRLSAATLAVAAGFELPRLLDYWSDVCRASSTCSVCGSKRGNVPPEVEALPPAEPAAGTEGTPAACGPVALNDGDGASVKDCDGASPCAALPAVCPRFHCACRLAEGPLLLGAPMVDMARSSNPPVTPADAITDSSDARARPPRKWRQSNSFPAVTRADRVKRTAAFLPPPANLAGSQPRVARSSTAC